MKVLIFGANGFLGRKTYSFFSEQNNENNESNETNEINETRVLGTSHSNNQTPFVKVDIRLKQEVSELFQTFKPDLVINCAAICDVKKCEEDYALAYEVHVKGTKNIAEGCREHNAIMVCLSSDYIFDGTSGPYDEASEPNPLNNYGKTKVLGEEIVKKIALKYIILRPTIMYGFNGEDDKPNFSIEVINKIKKGEEIFADNERRKYPILIDDIAECINHLVSVNARGTFNIGTEKGYTRFEWAQLIAKIKNSGTNRLFPEANKCYNTNRPNDARLLIDKLKFTGFKPHTLEEGFEIMSKQMRDTK
jgi:dTDP-4-dehydrorhamnose reductase